MNFAKFSKSIAAFVATVIASPIGVTVCAALHITNTPLYYAVIAAISALGGGLGTYAAPANTVTPTSTSTLGSTAAAAAKKAGIIQ